MAITIVERNIERIKKLFMPKLQYKDQISVPIKDIDFFYRESYSDIYKIIFMLKSVNRNDKIVWIFYKRYDSDNALFYIHKKLKLKRPVFGG